MCFKKRYLELLFLLGKEKPAKLVFDRKGSSKVKSIVLLTMNLNKGRNVSRFSAYTVIYWRLGNDSSAL